MKQKKPHIACVIPARGGSKEIYKKNLIDLCGKPLLVWSIEQARQSRCIDGVYVSSDDKEILDTAKSSGAQIIQRPLSMARDNSSSEEALLHAMDEIERLTARKIDILVFIQATSPLRLRDDIDKAVKTFISKKADSLFSAALLDDYCVWKCKNTCWDSVTFDYLNRGRRQDRDPFYLENGSIYIFRPEILRKNKNRMGGKISVYLMPFWQSYEIDKEDDVEVCAYFMENKILRKDVKPSSYKFQDTQLIVYDFDGVLTNNSVILQENGLESVAVSRADGLAISIFQKKGIPQIILSTEKNKVVEARARKLNLPVLKGIADKKKTLMEYCGEKKIDLKKVIYVGNDINDLEAMSLAGMPVCPMDAAKEIKKISKIRLLTPGGSGVVRELLTHFEKFI